MMQTVHNAVQTTLPTLHPLTGVSAGGGTTYTAELGRGGNPGPKKAILSI